MCGISGIILKKSNALNVKEKIHMMSNAMLHRGPDGEGFLLNYNFKRSIPYSGDIVFSSEHRSLPYHPVSHLSNAEENVFFAFGHRRLAIIDLKSTGHQPMCDLDEKIWITFNGEIYNYLELKQELISKGYRFVSDSDTEVVLTAYKEWGESFLDKLDGMWAFCIYDSVKNRFFASRDRLGVKPFYFINTEYYFAFASEQKAFVKAGLIKAETDLTQLHDYLINGRVENTEENFFKGLKELPAGNSLIYYCEDQRLEIKQYFKLKESHENEKCSDEELILQIKNTLDHSVRLRLRSDVEVGTCLSGGIDSSILAALMSKINGKRIHCFTSVFKGESFNEESFAAEMAKEINSHHHIIEPTANSFLKDIDELIYSQDVPIWDTSTYSQFSVMKLASQNKIKVVLDGQGADELFGGYHHHFVAKWNGLFKSGQTLKAIKEISASSKSIPDPFLFFAKEKVKEKINKGTSIHTQLFSNDFIHSNKVVNPVIYFDSVNAQQMHDIEKARLKPFLKCEDRCGMWHSVESRTPFSDDLALMQLMFSFNGDKKIKDGVSKYLLREAFKDLLPQKIYARYDKRGFETPMKRWMKLLLPKIKEELNSIEPDIIHSNFFQRLDTNNDGHMKILFKLFVYIRWKKVFSA